MKKRGGGNDGKVIAGTCNQSIQHGPGGSTGISLLSYRDVFFPNFFREVGLFIIPCTAIAASALFMFMLLATF